MKEAELRRFTTCARCRNKIGASGLPLFWRVRVERFGIDLRAVQRQDGLGAFLGNSMLANVMGDDADLATPMMDPVEIAICETCGTQDVCVAVLAEGGA